MPATRRNAPAWAAACIAFLAAEIALRLYWIAGGRWAYTACDRTDLGDPTGGCGADRIATVPFWTGWGPILIATVLLSVPAVAARRPAAAWISAAFLLVAAFPLHLLFEIPTALAGRPSDWRDLGARLALVTGGAAFAGLARAVTPPRAPVTPGYHPVPRWTRRWGYAAVAMPIAGWAVPHGLWLLGVPFGITAGELDDIRANLDVPTGLAITGVPPLAGLLVLGLIQRWGQQFPHWVPLLGGRAVPPLLAVVPAGLVAISLVAYGGLSTAVFAGQLLSGELSWAEVARGWAVAATLLVFVGWGVALAVTTTGYLLTTRPR